MSYANVSACAHSHTASLSQGRNSADASSLVESIGTVGSRSMVKCLGIIEYSNNTRNDLFFYLIGYLVRPTEGDEAGLYPLIQEDVVFVCSLSSYFTCL